MFSHFFESEGYVLSVRQVELAKEISTLHRWVNLPYSSRFWSMQGELSQLCRFYTDKVNSGDLQLFFVCYKSRPLAFFEVYPVMRTELKDFIDASKYDYGIHLLLAPYKDIGLVIKKPLRRLSMNILETIIQMLFSNEAVNRIFAEPDADNINANRLALKAGFRFIKMIQFPDKKANLYIINKPTNLP